MQSAIRTADYQPAKVLSISPAEHDHTCRPHILDHIPVVVTSEQLPDGNWKDLLRQFQCLPEPTAVIVISANAGDQL